jgi:hypothetical protein
MRQFRTVRPDEPSTSLVPAKKAMSVLRDGEPLEDVMVSGHHVEEPMVAVAIEDDLAVPGSPDDDGSLGRAFAVSR